MVNKYELGNIVVVNGRNGLIVAERKDPVLFRTTHLVKFKDNGELLWMTLTV